MKNCGIGHGIVGDDKIGVRTTTPTFRRLVRDGRRQHDPISYCRALASAVATPAAGSCTTVGTLATAVPTTLRGAEAEHIRHRQVQKTSILTRARCRASHPCPPQAPKQARDAQQLMRSVKEAQTDILMICNSCCSTDGLKIPGLDPRVGRHPPSS